MDASLKKILKSVTLELRHLLEGRYDAEGKWKPGDLEERLAAIGVRRDKESVPVDELDYLSDEDKHARKVVDAYIQLREEADVSRTEAVAEFVRETAYTWANRLLALRCMESRDLIDEVILKKEVYGGRSLEHHRLAQRQPELCAGEDDGLFAVLDNVFEQQAKRLPMLFDPQAPGVALRPSAAKLRTCIELLSLQPEALRKAGVRLGETDSQSSGDSESQPATLDVFKAPDALGWAYQYWNTEEKDRVFEKVRTVKGAKIEGSDIVPATQLYTESYMVQFLVQNSLGATWMGMHPESQLFEHWDYYVRDADRAPVTKKPVRELTFLDPACGSGHFLLEAFDLFYAMYEEEGELTEPEEICDAILTKNLYGIDIDARSVQIAEAALWMKAAERAFDFEGVPTNLVAAVSSHLKGPHWEEFLTSFEKEPSVARVLRKFGESMEHIDELGSLARPNEDLKEIIAEEHAVWEQQVREENEANFLFPEMRKEAASGKLAFNEISDEDFGDRLFYRARAALDAFTSQARERGDFQDQFLGREAATGFKLLDVLGRFYDVVAANPPYMSSKSMGATLLTYLKTSYSDCAFDLFAAFIERIRQLAAPYGGQFSCVTMQSFMFTKSYERLRQHILDTCTLRHLVVLGAGAFSEITGEVVSAALTIASNGSSAETSVGWRLVNADNKQSAMKSQPNAFRFRGVDLSHLPGCPFAFWLPDSIMTLLKSGSLFRDFADVVLGMKTANNERFHRQWHEVDNPLRWKPLVKSVAGCRYYSHPSRCVDWSPAAVHHYSTYYSAQLPNRKYWGREGVGYTDVSTSSFCAQYMSSGGMSDFKANLVACNNGTDVMAATAFLNTSLVRYILWIFNPTMGYQPNDLQRLPVVPGLLVPTGEIAKRGAALVQLKKAASARHIFSCDFDPQSALDIWRGSSLANAAMALQYEFEDRWQSESVLELEVDEFVFSEFGIDRQLRDEIWSEQGVPVAALPDVADQSTHVGEQICDAYKTGTVAAQVERSEASVEPQRICDNDLSYVCSRIGVSPLQVIAATRERHISNDGFQRDVTCDLVSLFVLKIAGFCWPRERQAENLLADVADDDGVIPTFGSADESLSSRIRPLLNGLCGSKWENEWSNINGMPYEEWLAQHFFAHHCKQFDGRPLVWQIESRRRGRAQEPAYSAMVCYHKLDHDLLLKVQKQVEDVLGTSETELRGITTTPIDGRSERQEHRRLVLEDAVSDCKELVSLVRAITGCGFGPDALLPTLRQYGVDDVTIAMKAKWLKRLTSLLSDSELPQWLDEARRVAVHDQFPKWVDNSIEHLSHHCASVGIKPPKINDLGEEPTSAVLSKLICSQARQMMKDSLKCACDVWWKQFDDIVLSPLKEQVKEMKAERTEIKEKLDADPAPEADEVMGLKLRDKQLREELKPIEKKIKTHKAKATKLRAQIEAWSSDEPLTWETWLAEQPLFDHVASIDGKKAPPKTIAEFVAQESAYIPDLNDGVRVNIAPLQKAGILAADVLAAKDVDKAIADRAEWRADERRWVREGILPQPGWWPVENRNETRG